MSYFGDSKPCAPAETQANKWHRTTGSSPWNENILWEAAARQEVKNLEKRERWEQENKAYLMGTMEERKQMAGSPLKKDSVEVRPACAGRCLLAEPRPPTHAFRPSSGIHRT